jgi:hypothetical protein
MVMQWSKTSETQTEWKRLAIIPNATKDIHIHHGWRPSVISGQLSVRNGTAGNPAPL